MLLTLRSVKFKNFRTIGEDVLNVNDRITILVGANECGKTNLLEGIEFLDPEEQLNSSDVKINSEYARKNVLPDMIFHFTASDELAEILRKYAKYFEKYRDIFLIRKGNDEKNIRIEPLNGQNFGFFEAYKNISDVEQKVNTKNGTIAIPPNNYIVSSVIYKKNIKLFREKKLQKCSKDERDKLLSKTVIEKIEENLPNVFLWKFLDKYYIPKDVPIDFYTKKEEYQSVINLFYLGGIDEDKIASHLTNRDSEYIHNFLTELSKKVTKIINNTWKQRKNIKLNLHYKDTWIEILVEEKGYQIDPKKRSEGLQWYLTFLINFRSKLQTLKNNIILFDQPGDKLHPGGQKDLLERIEELSEQNQVIYSTHTPFMINREYPERVRLITRPDDDTVIINDLSKKEIFKDELLRNSLGFALSDIAPVANKNIIVEGLLDKVIFQEFIRKLRKFKFTMDMNQAVFIPAHGASKILYYATILKNNDLNVVAIFDNDTEGKNAIITNKKKKVLDNCEILSVAPKNSKIETIEDLLPINLVKDCANEVGINYNRSFAITSLAIPVMTTIKGYFAAESIPFTDEIKASLCEKIIDKFKKIEIDQETLKADLKNLYDLLKIIKKKI